MLLVISDCSTKNNTIQQDCSGALVKLLNTSNKTTKCVTGQGTHPNAINVYLAVIHQKHSYMLLPKQGLQLSVSVSCPCFTSDVPRALCNHKHLLSPTILFLLSVRALIWWSLPPFPFGLLFSGSSKSSSSFFRSMCFFKAGYSLRFLLLRMLSVIVARSLQTHEVASLKADMAVRVWGHKWRHV